MGEVIMKSPKFFSALEWKSSLQEGDKGWKKNMTNLMIHLENVPGIGQQLKFNELTQDIEWNGKPFQDPSDTVAIRMMLDDMGFEPAKGDLFPAIVAHANKNKYHPVRDYLEGVKWDRIPRIDTWLIDLLGADDTPFTRIVSRKALIAAVARAYSPGCKVDTVLILEGPQGVKKSSAIEALFSAPFFSDNVDLFRDHKQMVMSITGSWCVELAEFVSVLRRDPDHVKGLLSVKSDKVVLPYAKVRSTHPRQCVFWATYNPDGDEGYLEDMTGNRRYWPVKVTHVDLDKVALKRDQLWAEAKAAFFKDEPWWLNDDEAVFASAEVTERASSDAWETILEQRIDGLNHIPYTELYSILNLTPDRINTDTNRRIRRAMRGLGYSNEPRKIDGKMKRVWVQVRK